jgi:hypothetical protein
MVFQGVPFGSAKAGNLDRMDIASESNWQPGSCHAPVPPPAPKFMTSSLTTLRFRYSTPTAKKLILNFACAGREAESDLTMFRGVLSGSPQGILCVGGRL